MVVDYRKVINEIGMEVPLNSNIKMDGVFQDDNDV